VIVVASLEYEALQHEDGQELGTNNSDDELDYTKKFISLTW
jgi:hypothetical protein